MNGQLVGVKLLFFIVLQDYRKETHSTFVTFSKTRLCKT